MRRSLHRESTRQFLDDFVPDKANVSAVVIARKRDLREGRGKSLSGLLTGLLKVVGRAEVNLWKENQRTGSGRSAPH